MHYAILCYHDEGYLVRKSILPVDFIHHGLQPERCLREVLLDNAQGANLSRSTCAARTRPPTAAMTKATKA